MPAVQWAKLVMNLNNAINALSGIPLAAELAQRELPRAASPPPSARRSTCSPRRTSASPADRVPPRWIPRLLACPTRCSAGSRRASSRSIPQARSSMWDDSRGEAADRDRLLSGEVVALAERLGTRARAP